ncbi:MAG: oligosaccharide flippase family protein, partial [Thermoleophilia bacterium]|nr:oligosaccharide flippase family protein [Thermoleophilia bacterium]
MTEIAVDRTVAVAERARRAPRSFDGAALLSGATLASGVFAYAYHVLAARTLGPEAYGLVAVLWAALFLLVVVLFRPLEQTTSRALAHRLERGHEVRSVLRAIFRIYLVVAAAIAVTGVAGWGALADQLFLGDGFFVASLVVGLAAYGVAYVLRGVCAGLGWFNGYALLLVADGAARLAVVLPLVVVASR